MSSMSENMAVCDLKLLCNTSTNVGIYCSWFSLYKEACTEMPMGQCMDYGDMCPAGTLIHQCNTSILNLPMERDMEKNNTAMCKLMPGMDGCYCDQCTTLEKYGELCKEMGGGPGCEGWTEFCNQIPKWSLCTNVPGEIIGEMKMYFHWGWYDYILFKGWIPYNQLTYAISIIAVFLIGLLHEGYKALKVILEMRWKMDSKYERIETESTSLNTKHSRALVYAPFDWQRDTIRALYKTIDVALHYIIMLIAMTFNGGLFIAVILGYGVGHLLFSRVSKPRMPRGSFLDVDEENCH
jgi:copper transporter 1